MIMDRLTAMEVFIRVVETGSFSGAARLLRVGQPAVSKTIAQLEQRLGVSLLLRSPRGLTPTEAGHKFYERAKRAIEEADEAELAARDAGNGLSGRLRFSSGVTFGRLHIIPRLPLFLAAHPELTVEAILDDRDVDLIEGGIDVGFAWACSPTPRWWHARSDSRVGWCSAHPLISRKWGSRLRRLSCYIFKL
jgi:DNA-binding transcriptional LysR family regulator